MASEAGAGSQANGTAAAGSPIDPCTPQPVGPQPGSSQVTLASTEIPASPTDPNENESLKLESMDDQSCGRVVIPSSLTPPPSAQAAGNHDAGRPISQSQQSLPCSPPATILNRLGDREMAGGYTPPSSAQVGEASSDELRSMLQTCVAEYQKLKMKTAHHKLQYGLLSLQAEEDAMRSAVEHKMVRREVDVLLAAEHSGKVKKEASTMVDSARAKHAQMEMWYEAAMEENEMLRRRVKVAKKIIQQKEEESICLEQERELLLNRIRENRERFHMLCSPGGIFHGAMSPGQPQHQQQQQQHHHHHHHHPPPHRQAEQQEVSTPQRGGGGGGVDPTRGSPHREDTNRGREHGLSALLQAMSQSQDNNSSNNSAPSTPLTSHRAVQRHSGKHNRNAQSLSSLPVTPSHRSGDSSLLLPSADLVPQTEPGHRYTHKQSLLGPTTPPPRTSRRGRGRRSRESTISADDETEELARQALESVEEIQSLAASHAPRTTPSHGSRRHQRHQPREMESDEEEDEVVVDSRASQAATEMLRRRADRGLDLVSPSESYESVTEKRKQNSHGGEYGHASPTTKKMRVGLGIQYSR